MTLKTGEALVDRASLEFPFDDALNEIRQIYRNAAETMLPEKHPLREYVLDYCEKSDSLEALRHIFISKSLNEIKNSINKLHSPKDQVFFLESMQKNWELYERQKREDMRAQRRPVADEDEYAAGVYRDGLEIQVRDAVFNLRKKGYDIFESGFNEVKLREQYMGMYNQNVAIPESLVDSLKKLGFKVWVDTLDDRSQIRISPLKEIVVTLDEWKKIWDIIARQMPNVAMRDSFKLPMYGYHIKFRQRQDALKQRI